MSHPWYEDASIYHIWSFGLADAPFENPHVPAHTLDNIARWIPHIQSLGCGAVLFSPVLQSKTHGYDVTDYMQIDSRLGTNEEFAALVKKFHEAGIKVILDSVYNHCGRDFFAFQALKNGDRGYTDWFSGVDFNRRSPMGDDFTYDSWSGYYELCKFNLHNKQTRDYLFEATRFWIQDLDIDGMRLDSANVMDFAFMRDLRRYCTDLKPDFWLMGEVVHGDYPRWVNADTLHSVTGYMLFKAMHSAHVNNNLYELAHTVSQAQPDHGRPLYNFVDNHDQPRIASNIGGKHHLKTVYSLMYTLPGIPSIYYGSEFGIEGVKAGGSDAPLRPYLDPENLPQDDIGLFPFIQKLAAIRAALPALRYGSYRQVYLEYHKPYIFEREYEGKKVWSGVHVGDDTQSVNWGVGNVRDLLTGEVFQDGNVTFPPHTARILIMDNVEVDVHIDPQSTRNVPASDGTPNNAAACARAGIARPQEHTSVHSPSTPCNHLRTAPQDGGSVAGVRGLNEVNESPHSPTPVLTASACSASAAHVLVTGGAGFIGSHTVVELLNAGCNVVVFDNFSNADPAVLAKIEQVAGLPFTTVCGDLLHKDALRDVFRAHNISAVIHFGGLKAVGESTQKPLLYHQNNITGTLNLLEIMQEFGCKQIVFSSSATVYGINSYDPIPEETPLQIPASPYGKTKYTIEQILIDLAAADPDFSAVLLRYFNPIGAHPSGLLGEDPAGIPNNLFPYIAQVAAGKRDKLSVFGDDYKTKDGTGVRDYLHVVDLADAHAKALGYAADHTGAEPFNLGTGRGTSVLELIDAFERCSGVHIPYAIAPRRAGDLDIYFADPKKAQRVLGWKAKYSVDDMCLHGWKFIKAQSCGAERSSTSISNCSARQSTQ